MATFQASKRATTLSPTIRSLASGVPVVSRLNLTVRAPASDHDHGHGGSATRSDSQPKWSGGIDVSSAAGLVSRTVTTSEYNFQSSLEANLISVCSFSMPLYSFPTTLHPHFCCEERYARGPRLLKISHRLQQQPYALLLYGRRSRCSLRICCKVVHLRVFANNECLC